jgi:acyl carrier protein
LEKRDVTPFEVIQEEIDAPVAVGMILDDLAIDSLEYIELIRRLEQVFCVRIEERDLEDVTTLGELCRLVDRLRTTKGIENYVQS